MSTLPERTRGRRSSWPRRVVMTVVALAILAAVWELYKAFGPAGGIRWGVVSFTPRTDDRSMPHLWTMLTRLGDPVSSVPASPSVAVAVLQACLVTLAIAGVGWVFGCVLGLVLALLMQRVRIAERAILPWVVLSQTVPLIALAPLVVTWGSQIHVGTFAWQQWMSVAVIAGYLAFFPVAVGMLRGLKSPDMIHVELFDGFAVGWWRTLIHLRLPASVPYLLPALRLAAAAAVIGSIVAEVSTGTRGGIGRTIMEYALSSGGDPAKPWAAILGAILVGLVAAGLVALIGRGLGRFRRAEVSE